MKTAAPQLVLLDGDSNPVETFALDDAGYEQAYTRLRYWALVAHRNMVDERLRGVFDGPIEEADTAYFLGVDPGCGSCIILMRSAVRGSQVVVEPVPHRTGRIVRGHALP